MVRILLTKDGKAMKVRSEAYVRLTDTYRLITDTNEHSTSVCI